MESFSQHRYLTPIQSNMSAAATEGGDSIIGVIGDEDTVTGFLLAGVGQRDAKGSNFLVVDASAYVMFTGARLLV